MPVVDVTEFGQMFGAARRSVLRLESRSHTDVPEERPHLRAFLAGELPEIRMWEHDGWTRMVGRLVAAGVPFQRVRVMSEPLSDYNRYMVWCGSRNVSAGEDVRYLTRSEADRLDLPDHDFWVIDSTRLLELRFTGDGRPLQHNLIDDSAVVRQHEDWVRRALAVAIPADDYLAEDLTRAWPPIRLGVTKGV